MVLCPSRRFDVVVLVWRRSGSHIVVSPFWFVAVLTIDRNVDSNEVRAPAYVYCGNGNHEKNI